MSRTIISEGKTSTEAIEKGLKELGISKHEAEIKIIEEKKKSFFSILDPHIVKVEITEKETSSKKEIKNRPTVSKEEVERAKNEVEEFLKIFIPKISDKVSYVTQINKDYVMVEINGEGSAKLIGYRGEALNSLQLILSNIVSNKAKSNARIILDIENYREKRKKTLEELATKIEGTVTRTGKKITLEPMTPYERKVIHTKLQDSKTVKTYSIGEESNRRIVIAKK